MTDAPQKEDGLVFDAARIREKGGLKVSRALPTDVFAGLLKVPDEVSGASVDLAFSVGGESLLLEGTVKAALRLECARCGAPFTADFSETFDEVYEDTVESVDVRGPLRESVALMPPLKPLCAEDCRGLCRVCGGNLDLKACGCAESGPAQEEKRNAGRFEALKGFSALPPGEKKGNGGPGKKRGNRQA